MKLAERLFGDGGGFKKKIIVAARRIDGYKREVANLRFRLEGRRQSLFEHVVRAIEQRDDDRASVYAVELSEVKKVLRVVTVSELALTQMMVRLESIRDIGDVSVCMEEAFKILRGISPSVSGVVPALENATDEVKTMLSETLVGLGNLSPSVSLDIRSEGGEELLEKAKIYADEKAMSLKENIPPQILSANGDTVVEKVKRVALLATDDDSMEDSEFKPTIFMKSETKSCVEESINSYVSRRNGNLNVLEASTALNIPTDEVEKTVFKMVSEGKLKLGSVDR